MRIPLNRSVFCTKLFVLAVFLLSGCQRSAPSRNNDNPSERVTVQTASLTHGSIIRQITLPGEIKSYQQATLYAKVTGYLKTITVDKGDRVSQGDLLAEIEVPEMLSDLARCKTELEVAALDFKRLNDSQQKAPDLVVPLTVDNARAKVDVAKANLERTQTLLNFAKLTAPFSGIVINRMVDPGAFIPAATAGNSPQNAAILTLSDFNKVRVSVAVPEAETARIKTGQPMRVTAEALPGRAFETAVTRFSYSIDERSKTMLVEGELANPNLELRPGMYVTVRIGIERKENSFLAPVEALVTEKSGAFVWTVAEGKARRIKVEPGINDGAHFEIISKLDPAQSVILVGKKVLVEGQPVTVAEKK